MAETWEECKTDAIEALDEAIVYSYGESGRVDRYEADEMIHEHADGGVPVYNGDRMSVASHPDIWTRDSELSGDNDDLTTRVGVTIYEALHEALSEHLTEVCEERDEAADDDELREKLDA
jgi:hypothetical protein